MRTGNAATETPTTMMTGTTGPLGPGARAG